MSYAILTISLWQRIPQSFVNKCGEEISNPVLLLLPNGDQWNNLDADVWLIDDDGKKFAVLFIGSRPSSGVQICGDVTVSSCLPYHFLLLLRRWEPTQERKLILIVILLAQMLNLNGLNQKGQRPKKEVYLIFLEYKFRLNSILKVSSRTNSIQ